MQAASGDSAPGAGPGEASSAGIGGGMGLLGFALVYHLHLFLGARSQP